MGKLKRALTEVAITINDQAIMSIPDPVLQAKLMALSLAVRVPYIILRELLPSETDKYIKEVLDSNMISQKVINSPEFQQALGNTLQNMVSAKEKEKRDIIKRAFTGAYINSNVYAKDNMDRLQETAQSMSIPSLQHLSFLKREILPYREMDIEGKAQKSQLPGFTDLEYKEHIRRTSAISLYYDSWYVKQRKDSENEFNLNPNDENRSRYDLSGADEQKRRSRFMEFWTEYNSLGIFRQGNDPAIGTLGGGGGTVQFLTDFGERFLDYISDSVKIED